MLMIGSEKISLYFHVPFCTKKCPYCHFYVIPNNLSSHATLVEGFCLELERWRSALKNCTLASVYFGGGTPSLLEAKAIEHLLSHIKTILPYSSNHIEITLEANPETLHLDKASQFASAGINRLSIGIQSLDDSLLCRLGRTHHAKKALDAIEVATQAGISNVSIDLMYDVPGQTLSSWKNTLAQLSGQPIKHLSLYNLTIEPNTVFFKNSEQLLKEVPDPEVSLEMYELAVQQLHHDGLDQYEISAFSRPGYASQHNTCYWTGRPFLGIGPSAFSYWDGARFRNQAHLQRYCALLKEGSSPIDFSEKLPLPKKQRELFAIGLRILFGVDIENFIKNFGPIDEAMKETIQKLIEQELLQKEGPLIKLTKKGILFYDTVATEMI